MQISWMNVLDVNVAHAHVSDKCLESKCVGPWDVNVTQNVLDANGSDASGSDVSDVACYSILRAPKHCTDSKCVPEIMKCFRSTGCRVYRESIALELLRQIPWLFM